MSPIDNHDTGKSRWIPANRGNNRSSKWFQLYVGSPKLIETTIRDSFLDLLWNIPFCGNRNIHCPCFISHVTLIHKSSISSFHMSSSFICFNIWWLSSGNCLSFCSKNCPPSRRLQLFTGTFSSCGEVRRSTALQDPRWEDIIRLPEN